eukprot:3773805-Rhodomonas_salina.1
MDLCKENGKPESSAQHDQTKPIFYPQRHALCSSSLSSNFVLPTPRSSSSTLRKSPFCAHSSPTLGPLQAAPFSSSHPSFSSLVLFHFTPLSWCSPSGGASGSHPSRPHRSPPSPGGARASRLAT